MFLVKREELRDFDVIFFFLVFFGCFFVFGREEKHSEIIKVGHRAQEVFFFFFLGLEGTWGLF